jgi:hypothetical protein
MKKNHGIRTWLTNIVSIISGRSKDQSGGLQNHDSEQADQTAHTEEPCLTIVENHDCEWADETYRKAWLKIHSRSYFDQEDRYDAHEYSDPHEFWRWNEDEFRDYDDAELYWMKHH